MRHRSSWFSLCIVVGVSWLAVGVAHAQTSIGIGATMFFDSGTIDHDQRIGPQHDTDHTDVSNARLMAGALTFLYDLDGTEPGGFRLGGELRYFGKYAAETDADKPERSELGTEVELGVRGEWLTELAPKFTLALGMRFDLTMLLPTGDLADEANRLADEGVPTSDGARFGWTIMPMVGARYELHERVHARLDLGFGWTRLDLFDIDDTVQGINYERDDTLSTTRFEVTLGVELSL